MPRTCRNPDCPDLDLSGSHGEYGDAVASCPKCGRPLEHATPITVDPPRHEVAARPLVPLCAPSTSAELVVLTSLLRSERIASFVHNEHFGSLHVGPVIPLFNQRTVFVDPADLDRAREVIAAPQAESGSTPDTLSNRDRLRMLLEVIVFHWVIPASRRSRVSRDT